MKYTDFDLQCFDLLLLGTTEVVEFGFEILYHFLVLLYILFMVGVIHRPSLVELPVLPSHSVDLLPHLLEF